MSDNSLSRLLFVLYLTVAVLILLEVGLRMLGLYDTYGEVNSHQYHQRYRTKSESWFHTWNPNSNAEYDRKEFYYLNSYNELGHRERPFAEFQRDTTALKVIVLGDSFAEGDGTSSDSSWVHFAERNLMSSGFEVAFYNAGVCGSDVYFNAVMLEHKLNRVDAKLVIEFVNSTDIMDVIYRGGMERFNADGTMSGKTGPTWEFLFRFSHVIRAFVFNFLRYDGNLMPEQEKDDQIIAAANLIGDRICKTADYCDQIGAQYVVIVHPVPQSLLTGPVGFDIPFENTISNLECVVSVENIRSEMESEFGKRRIGSYYWPVDGHFNGKGYAVIGEIVAKRLRKYLPSIEPTAKGIQ